MTEGKAYAFFDCKQLPEHIRATLPDLQELALTNLELKLSEGVAVDEADLRAELSEFPSFKYTLRGILQHATNEQTAVELKDIMNAMISSPLYEQEKSIRMEIVYHEREWKSLPYDQ